MSAGSEAAVRQPPQGIARAVASIVRLLEALPEWPLQLVARLLMATIFWRSGRTKVEGLFDISDTTFFLFREEYALPLIPPVPAAYMATFAEHFFPVLLVAGIATRFSALALLGMTLVIQLFVYPDAYVMHGLWAVALAYLALRGGGLVSLDHPIRRHYMG